MEYPKKDVHPTLLGAIFFYSTGVLQRGHRPTPKSSQRDAW